MKTTKKIGVWMDHSIAHLMEFTSLHFEIETIESNYVHPEKNIKSGKDMRLLKNKEKKQLSEYYKKIGQAIKNYKRVILFGPTNAKVDLFDFLSEDENFLKIKFEIKHTDQMTPNQQHTFIKEYFSKA